MEQRLNPVGFTVNTVTATTINGTVVIPLNAPTGTWNVSVTTLYGGQVWKAAAFTVNNFPVPTITSVTHPPGNIGTTVLFTITGTNFQATNKTNVTIYNDITNTVLSPTWSLHDANDHYRQCPDSRFGTGRFL